IPYGHGQIYHPPGEVGPALLMPDGSVFATGATPRGGSFGHTAIWWNGVWSAGPNFPTGIDAGDNFAVLLPNGTALVETTNGELFAY
ncbi:hypothetical protein ACSTH0_23345, partial [Vibrio parahaemolyticus]